METQSETQNETSGQPFRPSQSGSAPIRRVSNMTPSQIEKKRAIDRENQRYFRAKKKAKIQALEKQVSELQSKLHEYQGREKLFQGTLPPASQAVAGSSAEPNGTYQSSQNSGPAMFSFSEAVTDRSSDGVVRIGSRILPSEASTQLFQEIAEISAFPDHLTDMSLDVLGELLPHHRLDFKAGLSLDPINTDRELRFVDFSIDEATLMSITAPFEAATLPHSAIILEGPYGPYEIEPTGPASMPPSPPEPPLWQQLPPHLSASTVLDHVILSTTEKARRWAREEGCGQGKGGELDAQAAGFPSISSLLNPLTGDDGSRPISSAAAAQVWRSPLRALPARLGFMYILSHLVRWLVCRTRESYARLPEFLRPTGLQRTVPHPAWVDTIVWPGARDAIIQHMDWGQFPTLRKVLGESISVNWPYTDSGTYLESADGQHLIINPAFEAHLSDVKNWSLGPEVADVFPFLAPYCRDKD